MSEEEAREAFRLIRWADQQGQAVLPRVRLRRASMPIGRGPSGSARRVSTNSAYKRDHLRQPQAALRDNLLAIAIFVNGAKGHSALQLSRDLDCQYKTAFVLAHKIREALAATDKDAKVSGDVEIDGMYAGGYVKPANYKENRRDRRLAQNQNGKRRVVIVARERNGKTITFVAKSEDAARSDAARTHHAGSTVYADEASHWDRCMRAI